MTGALRGLVLGAAIVWLIASCMANRPRGMRLTGTCQGACAHYIACKPGHPEGDRTRCEQECPQVFSDPESLVSYEMLSCVDAVEYVDGTPKKTAGHAR